MNTDGPSGRTPAAEYTIDSAFVVSLLAEQHPDLAHLPLEAVDTGWDNAIYRLGDSLAVRLPRRSVAAPLIVHEQAWLPLLADGLTLPVPVPYRTGTPTGAYPWRWSVVPWLPGVCADQAEPVPSESRALAAFLRSLHTPAPSNAPANPARGVPLQQRAASVETRMHRLSRTTGFIKPQVTQIWNEALRAPLDVAPTWLHGDLHSRNVLVEHGIISGIIDWGDITSGDCATDLASIWMLFSDSLAHNEALAAYGYVSEATVKRAKGWAVLFGVILLDTGLIDNPRNAAIGERILLRAVL